MASRLALTGEVELPSHYEIADSVAWRRAGSFLALVLVIIVRVGFFFFVVVCLMYVCHMIAGRINGT